MLRITTHHKPEFLTIQLEGKLAGPWVQELADCWERNVAVRSPSEIRVDLRSVMFLDAAGKELLTRLHAQHAQFVAAGCLMKAIVAEISHQDNG